MTSLVSEVAAILDGVSVTEGANTVVFTYVPWGKHYDRDQQPATGGLVTIRKVAGDTNPTDTGYGAERIRDLMDVHFFWEDEAAMDMDAFKEAIETSVRGLLRTNAKTLGGSHMTNVSNIVDLTDLQGDILIPHLVFMVEASSHETF